MFSSERKNDHAGWCIICRLLSHALYLISRILLWLSKPKPRPPCEWSGFRPQGLYINTLSPPSDCPDTQMWKTVSLFCLSNSGCWTAETQSFQTLRRWVCRRYCRGTGLLTLTPWWCYAVVSFDSFGGSWRIRTFDHRIKSPESAAYLIVFYNIISGRPLPRMQYRA